MRCLERVFGNAVGRGKSGAVLDFVDHLVIVVKIYPHALVFARGYGGFLVDVEQNLDGSVNFKNLKEQEQEEKNKKQRAQIFGCLRQKSFYVGKFYVNALHIFIITCCANPQMLSIFKILKFTFLNKSWPTCRH